MKPTRLLLQLVLWGAVLAAFNVLVERQSRGLVPRQVVRRIDATSSASDLFVGNSLVAAAIDAEAFDRAHPGLHALNIGLGFSAPPEHNILLRRSLRIDPERAYYGYYDFQLIEPSKGGWADLVGNRAMAYYVDLDLAIRFYARNNAWRALMMRGIARVPILLNRYAIWAKVEKLRRRFGEIGMEKQAVNRFGRAEDFRQLEAFSAEDFRIRCRRAVETRAEFAPAISDMFALLRERHIDFIVVEMPMSSDHRRRFYETPEWRDFRAYLAEQVRRAGGTYRNASDWAADDQFADHLHLNPEGAAAFSRRIGPNPD